MLSAVVVGMHLTACSALLIFALHRLWLLIEWALTKWNQGVTGTRSPRGAVLAAGQSTLLDTSAAANWNRVRRFVDGSAPFVTVQLPLYNEREVATRLLDAVAAFDWPRDRLEIQVLDDSDDDTGLRIDERAAVWRERGVKVDVLRRSSRAGFKAGALAHGTERAQGQFIAIFDADFVPQPDFLQAVMPAFDDQGIDMVQGRWGHLNRHHSWLTRAQSLFLDAHFAIEHQTRCWHGRFFNFNGTAGVWRKSAIARAGGWESVTLTEDLDLSLRAHIAGSRFLYLDDVEVPAELPADARAFKSQQYRWAKGSVQTARRRLPALWRSGLPLGVRIDATLKLFALLLVTMPSLVFLRGVSLSEPVLPYAGFSLGMATLPAGVHFVLAQRVRQTSWFQCTLALPLAIGVGAALSLNNARAALEGLAGVGSEVFVRTPKQGDASSPVYRSERQPLTAAELVLGLLHLAAAVRLTGEGAWLASLFFWLFGVALTALSVASSSRQSTAIV
ncbi:MAG: glycosyltransferase [Myxococcota bacterium]